MHVRPAVPWLRFDPQVHDERGCECGSVGDGGVLMEPATSRRRDGQLRRRWFTDEDMDLYLWFDENDELRHLQLCYDKLRVERVLSWNEDIGYSHDRVDGGEHRGGGPRTPIFRKGEACDVDTLIVRFRARSLNIDGALFDVVYRCLLRYSATRGTC